MSMRTRRDMVSNAHVPGTSEVRGGGSGTRGCVWCMVSCATERFKVADEDGLKRSRMAFSPLVKAQFWTT